MNYYYDRLIMLGADGIDFISFGDAISHTPFPTVLATITKQDFENNSVSYILKTGYLFWKLIDGKKVYIENK